MRFIHFHLSKIAKLRVKLVSKMSPVRKPKSRPTAFGGACKDLRITWHYWFPHCICLSVTEKIFSLILAACFLCKDRRSAEKVFNQQFLHPSILCFVLFSIRYTTQLLVTGTLRIWINKLFLVYMVEIFYGERLIVFKDTAETTKFVINIWRLFLKHWEKFTTTSLQKSWRLFKK